MDTPTRGQLKSLVYHRVVAERLRADPALRALARVRPDRRRFGAGLDFRQQLVTKLCAGREKDREFVAALLTAM